MFKTCSNSKPERLLIKKTQVKILQRTDGEGLDSVQKTKKIPLNLYKKDGGGLDCLAEFI